eukprot:CAMPEP_0206270248 /NCGR_PEP_ID=MMETSP0047_2-20121206/32761_1 /ASSEMBLY_ACC=CAM_ASM_000192 /TAXON_ID=195065 /ORGANISM="Chroomonas mesostigmatica_cf, Strain CCMP1168" /LENGTH=387 /DNA_ID=CAMNT_0053698865 /DNA_START=112 /DNA_END=1275 /DNA_ORIENTATION=-
MPPLEKAGHTNGGQQQPTAAMKSWDVMKYHIDKDINAVRHEYHFECPGFVKAWALDAIKDKRDMPMIHLIYDICVTTIPAALLAFWSRNTYLCAAVYFLTLGFFVSRFCLLVHYSTHRPIFKEKYKYLNHLLPMVICNFFGLPPGVYYLHHCVMHHVENNVFPWDVSSTEPYQRDNFLHFLFYWLRFTCAIWIELPYYAWKKGRYELLKQCVSISFCYHTSLYLLYQYNPTGTWWIFILPFISTSLALMFGNWSQHIFIDPRNNTEGTGREKASHYRHTYNVLDSPYNRMTFNDGYHVEHHINSQRHWTELPGAMAKTLPDYLDQNAIVFKSLDFFIIGVLTCTGWYSLLTKNFLDIQEPRRSDKEIEAFLRERLLPIRRKQPNKLA